jgi:hypothetical protein
MPDGDTQQHPKTGRRNARTPDLIPREFLRIIAIWSLIPAYVIAGAFLGWLLGLWLNQWFSATPYTIALGLIVALGMAVRDMIRLRDAL